MTNPIEENFWLTKTLADMSEAEWEALCDGCGKCCYRKYIRSRSKKECLYYTRVACNLLDIKTGKCGNYANRFNIEHDCTKLTKENLPDFSWLPKTCAYRLLYEGKPLFDWHPLISKDPNSVRHAHIPIANGVHEKDIIDWFEFVIDEI